MVPEKKKKKTFSCEKKKKKKKKKMSSALFRATKQGNINEVKKGLKSGKCSVSDVDESSRTVLHVAVSENHLELAKLLVTRYKCALEARDKNGWRPLHCAAHAGNFECVEYLLDAQCHVGALTSSKASALHYFFRNGPRQDKVFYEKLCHRLIASDSSPDVNLRNVNGETALHMAVVNGQPVAVQLLLKYSALPDIPTDNGDTPLNLAVRANQIDIAVALLGVGASPDVAGPQGTARQMAISGGNQPLMHLFMGAGTSQQPMGMPMSMGGAGGQPPPPQYGMAPPPLASWPSMVADGGIGQLHAAGAPTPAGSDLYQAFLDTERGCAELKTIESRARDGQYLTYAPNPREKRKGDDDAALISAEPIVHVKEYQVHPALRPDAGPRQVQARTTSLAEISLKSFQSPMNMNNYATFAAPGAPTPRPTFQGGAGQPPLWASMPTMAVPPPQQQQSFQPPQRQAVAAAPPIKQWGSAAPAPDPLVAEMEAKAAEAKAAVAAAAAEEERLRNEMGRRDREAREAEEQRREQDKKDAEERERRIAERAEREREAAAAAAAAQRERDEAAATARRELDEAVADAAAAAAAAATPALTEQDELDMILAAEDAKAASAYDSESESESESESSDDDGMDAAERRRAQATQTVVMTGPPLLTSPPPADGSDESSDESSDASSGDDDDSDDDDEEDVRAAAAAASTDSGDQVDAEIERYTKQLTEMISWLTNELDKTRVKTSRQLSDALRDQAQPFLDKYGRRHDLPNAVALVERLHAVLKRYDVEIEGAVERLGLEPFLKSKATAYKTVGRGRRGRAMVESDSDSESSDCTSDYSSDDGGGGDLSNFGMGVSMNDI
jgi:ankyrin repeat protein